MVLIEGEFPLTWFFTTALLSKRETKVSSVYTWTDDTAEGVYPTAGKREKLISHSSCSCCWLSLRGLDGEISFTAQFNFAFKIERDQLHCSVFGAMVRAWRFSDVTECRAVSNLGWCRIFREISCLSTHNLGTLFR